MRYLLLGSAHLLQTAANWLLPSIRTDPLPRAPRTQAVLETVIRISGKRDQDEEGSRPRHNATRLHSGGGQSETPEDNLQQMNTENAVDRIIDHKNNEFVLSRVGRCAAGLTYSEYAMGCVWLWGWRPLLLSLTSQNVPGRVWLWDGVHCWHPSPSQGVCMCALEMWSTAGSPTEGGQGCAVAKGHCWHPSSPGRSV